MACNIQLLSDLHLEAHPHFVPTPAAGADLLVLAGDVGSYQAGSKLLDQDFGLARFSPLQGWPTPVLFVPGNHEYDLLDFDATHLRLRATCERLGIHWLEREVLTLQQLTGRHAPAVRFVGTTLWSDFDALSQNPAAPETDFTKIMKQRDKAYRAANFYLRKAGGMRHGQPMLAEQIREQALHCQAWLEQALNTPFDGPTVAVTHFAPSLKSMDPRYGLAPGTAGFCNSLDHLAAKAQFWLHGHLHAPSDYLLHGCHVLSNPLGYASKNEQLFFRPDFCVNVQAEPVTEAAPA